MIVGRDAQSEAIGIILMTAVVVILVSVTGAFVLDSQASQIQNQGPLAQFDAEIGVSALTIQHTGGDRIELANLDLILRSDTSEQRYNLDDRTDRTSDTLDTNALFQTGESITVSHSFTESIRILLIDTSTGTVLYDNEKQPPSSSPETPTPTSTPVPAPPTSTPTPTPATPTPTPSPTVSGYTLRDTSENSNTNYELLYDIDGTENFDRIEVTFDNRNNDWGDATSSASAERGTITFSQGGQQGATYDITIRVFNTNGTVTDTISITDTADESSQSSGDLTESDSPSFTGTVIDDLGGDEANYEVSYNVSNRSNFGSVRVQYTNLDSGGADATYTSTDPRHNIDNYAEASFGGTSSDEYRIRVELLDTDGIVVDERIVTDVADGTDPSGNADLTRASSPTLSSYSVIDNTQNNNGEYMIQYQVSNSDSDFSQVEAILWNTDNSWATQTLSSSSADGDLQYNQGGVGDNRYRITVRVLDNDGIVVDEVTVTDIADNTNP